MERDRFHRRNSNGTTNNRTLPTKLPQQLSMRERNNPRVTIQSISIRRINPPYVLPEQYSNTSIQTLNQNNQLSPRRQWSSTTTAGSSGPRKHQIRDSGIPSRSLLLQIRDSGQIALSSNYFGARRRC